MFFVLLLFIKSPSTDPNVLWFCFNCSKRRNIFRENFFKIGNSRRNIKLLVTGYVINYLTADCHMPNRKEGKWPRDFNALGKCCEFLNRPKPLMRRWTILNPWDGAGKRKSSPHALSRSNWKLGRLKERGKLEFQEKSLSRTIWGNPDSEKFLLVQTGNLCIGILNLARRIRNPSYD